MKTTHTRSTFYLLAVLAAGIAVLLDAGCSKKTTADVESTVKGTASKIGDAATSAWNNLKDATYDQRATLSDSFNKASDSMEKTAGQWGDKISTLSGNARASAQSAYDDFKSALSDAKAKTKELGSASAGTWDNVKDELSKAWKKAQDSYARLQASFTSQK